MKIHPLTFFLYVFAVLVACTIPVIERAEKSVTKLRAINELKQIGIYIRDADQHQDGRANPEKLLEHYFDNVTAYKAKVSYAPSIRGSSSRDRPYPDDYRLSYLIPENGTGPKPNHDHLPLVVTHLISYSSQFDQEVFSGSALALRKDSSVATCKVDKAGKALLKGQGKLVLLDNGPNTVWGDWEPGIRHDTHWKRPPPKRMNFRNPLVIAYSIEAAIAIYLLIRIFLTIKRRKAT